MQYLLQLDWLNYILLLKKSKQSPTFFIHASLKWKEIILSTLWKHICTYINHVWVKLILLAALLFMLLISSMFEEWEEKRLLLSSVDGLMYHRLFTFPDGFCFSFHLFSWHFYFSFVFCFFLFGPRNVKSHARAVCSSHLFLFAFWNYLKP